MNKIFSLILSITSCSLLGQGFLKGRVIDNSTIKPIPYVNISEANEITATNEAGEFGLMIHSSAQKLQVSSIGYYSLILNADSLLSLNKSIEIHLKPFVTTLQEVIIIQRKLSAKEIVKEALDAIPQNYNQEPFNMEFYSKISVSDSSKKTLFLAETIVDTYRQGYKSMAENHSRIVEKRVTGTNPIPFYDKKRKMEYFSYEVLPVFDIFVTDLVGTGMKYDYNVFNPKYFERLKFKIIETTYFDTDSVLRIAYDQNNFRPGETKVVPGELYISLRSLAILKHVRTVGKNKFEIIYKKYKGGYYPYFLKTTYPDVTRVNEKKKNAVRYLITHDVFLKRIKTEQVDVLTDHYSPANNWHLQDVEFHPEYWKGIFPK